MRKSGPKIKAFFKDLDYRHYISIVITVGFILWGAFAFPYAFPRFFEACKDFGLSIAYTFCDLFDVATLIIPSVNDLSHMPFTITDKVPKDWELFKTSFVAFFEKFGDIEVFKEFLRYLATSTASTLKIFVLITLSLVLIVPVSIPLVKMLKKPNNDYGKETKPLKIFKKISDYTYRPVKSWVKGFFAFLNEYRIYYVIWAIIWAFHFNLATVVMEVLAYYFYFVSTFDIGHLYIQAYKLMLDLSVMFKFVPAPLWILFGLLIINKVRKNRGYDNLLHMELMNRGFINERPIVTLICAKMGLGKTTLLTDMAISVDVMLRDLAYKIILENDLMFPFFPWINLENAVKRAIRNHSIYNLTTARRFVESKKKKFLKRPVSYNLFGYDFRRYGLTYNNALYVKYIWEVLYNYVQAYMLYIMISSFIQSNYSIRTDMLIQDLGNFPLWNSDFFKRDSRYIGVHSRHVHILDFDALRLGKRLIEENDNDYFEFGVVAITEIGKERQNALELKEVKKGTDETNQKNDMFNAWLKMIRHSATIDNVPFVKVFVDEQRPSSWGSDAKDLSEIIHIESSTEQRLAMPLFFVEEVIHSILKRMFEKYYLKYRYTKGNQTLFNYIFKTIYAKFHAYYVRTYNTFGFKVLGIKIEDGKQDGLFMDRRYFIMNKKIYSKRFSTDCFSGFFEEKAKRSNKGVSDLPEFAGEKATFAEMESMNSYFFNDLTRLMKKKNTKNKEKK